MTVARPRGRMEDYDWFLASNGNLAANLAPSLRRGPSLSLLVEEGSSEWLLCRLPVLALAFARLSSVPVELVDTVFVARPGALVVALERQVQLDALAARTAAGGGAGQLQVLWLT